MAHEIFAKDYGSGGRCDILPPLALVCPIYDLITLFAWGMEAYMTLLRVGFMLDEDLLGRKSGVGICFEAYLSNINPLLFFFFLRCLCYLLFLLSFVEQQHLQDYSSTMARSFAQRRDSTYKYRVQSTRVRIRADNQSNVLSGHVFRSWVQGYH